MRFTSSRTRPMVPDRSVVRSYSGFRSESRGRVAAQLRVARDGHEPPPGNASEIYLPLPVEAEQDRLTHGMQWRLGRESVANRARRLRNKSGKVPASIERSSNGCHVPSRVETIERSSSSNARSSYER